jgi:hypothetical protein
MLPNHHHSNHENIQTYHYPLLYTLYSQVFQHTTKAAKLLREYFHIFRSNHHMTRNCSLHKEYRRKPLFVLEQHLILC